MRQYTVIDVCCGGGLLAAGFNRAGFKIIMGIDIDPIALSSYSLNFPNALIWDIDIMNIDRLPESDIIIAGIPCQEFSGANRNPNPDKTLPLIDKYIELCQNSKAKYWLFEEVPSVYDYVKDKVPRADIWECSRFGSKNLRPRLFAGSFPDPDPIYRPVDNPAPTVMASETSLSLEEMKDLQGVPGWMHFIGSETQQRRQIGNGVPLEMGESLARGIMNDIEGRIITAHKPSHTLTAAFYRGVGGSRPYHSAKTWRYCRECKAFILVSDELGPRQDVLHGPLRPASTVFR